MPKKIDFSVIHVTSEDPKYRATELNTHGPTVKGWQSARNCEYPQEVVIQLDKRCSLNKIQLLAHQYLIPSKIELFSSNEDTNTVADVNTINWDYLGYITLSDNQSTGFKSRELKSANVPVTTASYVKLKLGKNHANSHNNNNQVSLIAVNVLGTEILTRRHSNPENAEKLNDLVNDPEYWSPYDDLAFEMYVDVDVAKIIREMETKKRLAVISERFEYARKLKLAMESIRAAGEKLGKYELEKRHAIELEDYERARHKKNQMDDYRAAIYHELCIEQLLETDGHCPKNDECNDETDASSKNPLSPTLLRVSNDKRANSPQINQSQVSPLHVPRHQSPKKGSPSTGSPTNITTRGSFRRRNKSAGAIVKSTYEMYEEKPLPALRHSQTNEFLRECQMDNDFKATSKLTEREKKQAALPILVFGNDLVEKFYSKHYCDKEEGLNRLKEELLSYDNSRMHTANKTARAAIFILHRTLRDKVFSVYNLANEVIRLFFVQFVPGRVSPAEVSRSVDKLLPELLTKSGDTSARIHHMAVHTILTMADCKNVRDLHIIPVHLSRPVSSSTHPRLALSRAEMVEQLIINHGISTDKQSGLTCRTLSEFGASGLHHPAEAVRKVSERILVLVYKVNPRLVRKQLPPDDDITRRNLLYRQLFHEFDKIDLQRKKEMLEKTRVIQQCSVPPNSDFLSPEPTPNEINKCPSTSNIQNIFNYDNVNGQSKNYTISKSQSGGNIQNNGTAKNESSSSASGISSPSNNSQKEEDEKQCIFCNQSESSILAVSNSMNSHYWRSCPMLVRCKECSQVVEVSMLTEHLLMECERRESYTQCSQCSEAVKISDIKHHVTSCRGLVEGYNRCPLCHENLEDEEMCWKKHLMGEKPCPKNTRIKVQVQKTVTIQV
ncbi:centrosomal protein of 104 kDa isoform X1 [Zophobas morio]|uniref:centrosomal protein of 104 kDa isoform X1 n=2 Tax=Zophobas morio TaxID=2755281 RepID=UPI0030830F1C